ncbi:MAG: sugar transferase [Mycobacterium sp.]
MTTTHPGDARQHGQPDILTPPDRKGWQSRYVTWLAVSDAVVIVVAVFLAQRIRFGQDGDRLGYWNVDYTVVSIAVIVVWLLGLTANRSRSPRVIGAGAEEYRRVWTATLSVFGFIAIVSMLLQLDIARGYLAIALPAGLSGLMLSRKFWRSAVAKRRRQGQFLHSVLAVGERRSVSSLIESAARNPDYGYSVVGICIPGGSDESALTVPGVGDFPVLGDETEIEKVIAAANIDTVALTATEHLGPQGIRDLSWMLEKEGVDLVVSPSVSDVASARMLMRPVAGLPLIHLEKPQYRGAKRFEKRAFDVCFSALVLLLAAPLMAIVALAIKSESRGPVFYRSERVGLDGRTFQMLKFRTMVDDADKHVDELLSLNDFEGGILFKMRDDPRITAVGKFLRKYSIDEIPQFINVLRRQMSVVGPRPPLPREVASYDNQLRRRLLVLPGITGLWQVSGRSDLSWEESVRLDLFYIENWSLISDLMIVLKTVRPMLRGAGAY